MRGTRSNQEWWTSEGGARPACDVRKESRGNPALKTKIKFSGDRSIPESFSSRQMPAPGCGDMPIASVVRFDAEAKFVWHSLKAPGNAASSARENVPWPSLRNMATGCLRHAVETTRSMLWSPSTSRASIRSPPTGATRLIDCRSTSERYI